MSHKQLYLLLLISFASEISLQYTDEEAFVETITDDEYDDDQETYSYQDRNVKYLEPDTENVVSQIAPEGRVLWSYPQTPFIEIFLKSPSINYVSKNPRDPFDFLRDHYPLPNGKFVTIFLLKY